MSLQDYLANKWLTELGTVWIALHHEDPAISGAYASEVFGSGYTRCLTTFTAPASRTIWNSTAIFFQGLPATTATHLGFWDAALNGNLLLNERLPEVIRLVSGSGYRLEPLTVAVSLG